MWNPSSLGQAVWQTNDSQWSVDARGGAVGLRIDGTSLVLAGVGDAVFPDACEQYVRGDRWCVNFPQGESSFALRLAMVPIEASADRIVLEVTIAIQTDLLDTHPVLDIESMCDDIDSLVPADPFGENEVAGTGSAPISIAKSGSRYTSVLLGSHDSPFTTNHSTDSLLRLRLFGEFLEKGVIRKARPWVVIDRSGNPPDHSALTDLYRRLGERPLPLTP